MNRVPAELQVDIAHRALDMLRIPRTDPSPDGCMGDDADGTLTVTGRIALLGERERDVRAATIAFLGTLPHPVALFYSQRPELQALVALLGEPK